MRALDRSPSTGSLIQYGAGFCAPPTWRNFDASPTLRFERLPLVGRLYTRNENRFPPNVEVGDIVRGLPVAPGSARAVYASHVIEHLALDDARAAFRNTMTLLAPGGLFRMVVPDLEVLARQYLSKDSPKAAADFMRESGLGKERRPRTLAGMARDWLGNSGHLWMWDFKALSTELADAGFVAVRRCVAGDSAEPCFADVEDPGRFADAVGVECARPR
jgi:Methyltransferase domain